MIINKSKLDKFYTSDKTVKLCIKYIKKYIKINKKKDLIIEPSAGNGSFINYIKKLCNNYIFYDIKPEHKDIIKKNFLYINNISNDIKKYIKNHNNIKNIHIIGNPPFGKVSSLALKFIKKCCEFCNTISFILPKSFKKLNIKNRIPHNFHLIFQKDLPKNSFIFKNNIYNVNCVFQIWQKKSYNRKIIKKEISKYFYFVNKNNADIVIRRVGSNAGKIFYNINNNNKNTNYFIKIKNRKNKKNIIDFLNNNLYKKFNNTLGQLSINKQELINHYNNIRK